MSLIGHSDVVPAIRAWGWGKLLTEGYSLGPVWITDVLGSALMIVLSIACLRYAVLLRRVRPENVLWTYLLALSLALTAFAVSRAFGHLANRLLSLAGRGHLWNAVLPYSGAVNTLTFVVVGSITLFFQRVQIINRGILDDKKALEKASSEVMRLNRDLRSLVDVRTRQLTATRDRYRAVFEGSMDMIFIMDAQGRFTDVNQAGLTTLGYHSQDALLGVASLSDIFVTDHDYEKLMEELDRAGFVKNRECLLRARSGEEILVLLSMTVIAPNSAGSRAYHGIAKDITAKRGMERQLQRADRLASLGQVSAGIAHEINNPLGIILGYAQLIMRGQEKGAQNYEDLRAIERQAQNCKRIVDDLLKFARASDTRKNVVDVNQCIREIVTMLSHQLELDTIGVETKFHPDLPQVVGDAEKVKQVFMNLLVNAKQAISGSGVIGIETDYERDDGRIRVSISDSGSGIPSELMDRIFDPFFTTKTVGEGTGLGLSVSYGIIQDHGGTIEVKSQVGEGSVFTIHLPVPAEGIPRQNVSRENESSDLEPLGHPDGPPEDRSRKGALRPIRKTGKANE